MIFFWQQLILLLATTWYTPGPSIIDRSIDFLEIPIEEALIKAKSEGKHIFLDTYSDWCLPCKQMEIVFVDKDVASFFNTNFINLRVDTDSPQGKRIAEDYSIVFLPTMIIIDPDGTVKSKMTGLLSGQELINKADRAIKRSAPFHDSSISSTPFYQKKSTPKEKNTTTAEPTVIYVHDQRASSARPHIMYHEAYLHLQLMDGKAHRVARKYLSTQEDWSTEKNMKFLFDFLNDVRSKEFSYLVDHRTDFEQLIGREKVALTIRILTDQHISSAYPRPSYEQVLRLYSLVNIATAKEKADQYWSTRPKK